MWHVDDRPLVEDAALPGTALVLHADRLQAWLSESLGEPSAALDSYRRALEPIRVTSAP